MDKIGKYNVIREIGRGGMGKVYHAVDTVMKRPVALKVTRWADVDDAQEREQHKRRLLRDARNAGQLNHPNIVTVYGFEEDGDLAFIVMEFIKGATLSALLRGGRRVALDRTARYISQAADALDYAHKNKIVHRDIKPENIMINKEDLVKIADFGISKSMRAGTMDGSKSQSGVVMGTLYYMSPEQVRGAEVTGRSDQFSIAVVAYQMLTGALPFSGIETTEVMFKISFSDPMAPDELNPSLGTAVNAVFKKALAKKPEDRYGSCAQFAAALTAAIGVDGHAAVNPIRMAARSARSGWTQLRHLSPRWKIALLLLVLLPAAARLVYQSPPIRAMVHPMPAPVQRLAVPGEVESLSFSSDGGTLAAALGEGGLRLWPRANLDQPFGLGSSSPITVEFSHQGNLLASAEKPYIRLWDVSERRLIGVLSGHSDWVTSLSFAPGDKILASGSDDQTVRFWDLAGQAEIPGLRTSDLPVTSLAFSPDGKTLVIGTRNKRVLLKGLGGEPLRLLGQTDGPVTSVAFSPGGGMVASGSEDRTVRLWSISESRLILALDTASQVRSVAFSPDGRKLAAGCADGTLRLWSMPDGKPLAARRAHLAPITSLSFSGAGRSLVLASGSRDKTVQLWPRPGDRQ